MDRQREILLGVTGSIAAYKAAVLLRMFMRDGFGVSVVMTDGATKFVTPLTFQTLSRRPVAVDLFAPVAEWMPGHISLADRADVMVIAPCTANVIAKLAHGIADDALTSTALAFRRKIVVAPAMNEGMYLNPATQENLMTLKSRGFVIVDPSQGELACASTGVGRLAELEDIVAAVKTASPNGQEA